MLRPRLPTIIFEVTQACDHACSHCYNIWNHPEVHRGMQSVPSSPAGNEGGAAPSSTDDLRPLLAHVLDQVDCPHVTLTGGEPLLREDLPELVSFLAQRDLRINLITNGHRLTDERATDLIRRGVSLFELPLLSYRRQVHDWLSGAHRAFDAVLAALAHIRAHRGKVVVAFVATRHNVADLAATLKRPLHSGSEG